MTDRRGLLKGIAGLCSAPLLAKTPTIGAGRASLSLGSTIQPLMLNASLDTAGPVLRLLNRSSQSYSIIKKIARTLPANAADTISDQTEPLEIEMVYFDPSGFVSIPDEDFST